MDDVAESPKDRPRRRRRLLRALGVLALLLVAFVAAIPWLLSTERARRWLLSRANATLNPGRLEVDRFAFSWFRPTRMDRFVLRNPQGEKVVDAPSAVWDRNLFQVLFRRPTYGTLHLRRAALDIERRTDGSIDIVEALRPILNGTPPTSFVIEIAGGSIRLRSPELAEPIRSDRFDLTIHRPPAPGRVTWDATFGDSTVDRALTVGGSFERWKESDPEKRRLELRIGGRDWPLALKARGAEVRGSLAGSFDLIRDRGLWSSVAAFDWNRLDLSGDALRGDRLALDRVSAHWKANQGPLGLEVEELGVRSPVGSLTASGPIPARQGASSRLDGRLDLAAIARALPRTLHLRDGLAIERGTASVMVQVQDDQPGPLWTAEAAISDFSGRAGETAVSLREPATLSARVRQTSGSFAVESLGVKSAFLDAEGRGDLDRGIAVAGTLDMAALARQLGDFLDLGGLGLDGRGRLTAELRREGSGFAAKAETAFDAASFGPKDDPLVVSGLKLGGSARGEGLTRLGDWRWEASIAVGSARRAGLALGPARGVARRTDDRSIAFDPIDTTLNGGTLRVVPELVTEPGLVLKLNPGTELRDAEVNEEASRRVLAFVAPILEGGSKVTGRVSARIDRAEIPLGSAAKTKTQVEGRIVFADVVFVPGPVAADLLGMIGRSDPTLRLDQPVVLSIADGRIHQQGLAVPVGSVTKIEITGDVGFDKSLDLMASLPLTPAMFPNGGLVGDVVAGTRINVPIAGTLNRPKIDREAFRAELARAGKGLMVRGATRGAAELLFRLAKPRDPNAPPPLTPAERREQRRERKMQRRGG